MDTDTHYDNNTKVLVTFRGTKIDFSLTSGITVLDVKSMVIDKFNDFQPQDIKLIYKGKQLTDDTAELLTVIKNSSTNNKSKASLLPKTVKIIGMGISSTEVKNADQELEKGMRNLSRIRDDLTTEGRRQIARNARMGRMELQKATRKHNSGTGTGDYKFHRVEALPMLPEKEKAQQILDELANDPGVLACLAKHKWSVGCLKELYPEGKVGVSEVCVLGLNKNKGQEILLRIRTDDLKGFRKMLNIREVLFHELAHNVYSDHDDNFFQLMRQIERECNEMDWTQGPGAQIIGKSFYRGESHETDYDISDENIGPRHLGGELPSCTHGFTPRELRAWAAMQRLNHGDSPSERNNNNNKNECGCCLKKPLEEGRNEEKK